MKQPPLDIAGLPAEFRKRRDIRALAMTVLKCPCSCGFVVGTPEGNVHHISQSRANEYLIRCDCDASGFSGECAHIMAVFKHMHDAANAPQKVK